MDPVQHLADCYEALRQDAVSGTHGHSLGLALFLREGMATWLRVGTARMPALASSLRQTSDTIVPAGLQNSMVMLLADMVLATMQETAP